MAASKYKPGDVIANFTLIEYDSEQGRWLAECVCERLRYISPVNFRNKKHPTCNCVSKSGSSLKNIWRHMLERCNDINDDAYKYYGAKGITVCDRWLVYENFVADMGERPEGHSLDRKDTTKGYEPSNCRWATREEQDNNRTVHSERKFNIRELSKKSGIHYSTIHARLATGMTIDQATNPNIYNSPNIIKFPAGIIYMFREKKFKAKPTINGKAIYLGKYDMLDEAVKVIEEAKVKAKAIKAQVMLID